MRLLADFWFRDRKAKVWTTPANYDVDGASIPRALWSLVGSPYTGDYRRASIVHDKACDESGNDQTARKAADRMFYQACRTGGCSIFEATLLYVGVRIGALMPFVPAWSDEGHPTLAGPRMTPTRAEESIVSDFQTTSEIVIRQGETDDIDEIERRTDDAISAVTGLNFR
jgi:hypothetical protein